MRLFYVFLVHIRMNLLGSVLFWNGSYIYCIYNGTPCMILKMFQMFDMRTLHKYENLLQSNDPQQFITYYNQVIK